MTIEEEKQYTADMEAFKRIDCLQNKIISLYESIKEIVKIKDEMDAVFAAQVAGLHKDIATLEQEKKGLK